MYIEIHGIASHRIIAIISNQRRNENTQYKRRDDGFIHLNEITKSMEHAIEAAFTRNHESDSSFASIFLFYTFLFKYTTRTHLISKPCALYKLKQLFWNTTRMASIESRVESKFTSVRTHTHTHNSTKYTNTRAHTQKKKRKTNLDDEHPNCKIDNTQPK